MPFIELDDIRLYYEEHGKGDAIVLTHGNSLFHGQWQAQVEEFSKTHRVIVWDVRGHGKTGLPSGPLDPESFSRDLIGLLDGLKIEKAVLCGLSMGGHISLQTAVRYPERVRGLVLIGAPFTNSFNWFETLTVPINLLSVRLMPLELTAKLTADAVSKITPSTRGIVEQGFGFMTHDQFLRQWAGNLRLETKHDLHKVQCRTLILHGEKDALVARQQKALAAGINGAEFYSIPGAGHLTNLDNPQAVNQHMREFLQKLKA